MDKPDSDSPELRARIALNSYFFWGNADQWARALHAMLAFADAERAALSATDAVAGEGVYQRQAREVMNPRGGSVSSNGQPSQVYGAAQPSRASDQAKWRLVPVQPTDEMISAAETVQLAIDHHRDVYVDDGEARRIWSLMLAAAPSPEAGSGEGVL